MPLPVPILDDRTYQQLRDELVRRIPVYTPEWTDHNASDPGVTLLELFAFLGENLLYRFNQIPEATQLAFLSLLEIPLRAATPARALITLERVDTGPSAGGPVRVALRTEAKAGAVSFETGSEVVAWPLGATAVARVAAPPPTTAEALDFANASIDALDGLTDTESAGYYVVRTVPTDPAAPSAQAVDVGATVDGALWIAVLRTRTTDPDLLGGAVLNFGIVLDEQIAPDDEIASGVPGTRAGNGPEMLWQATTATVVNGRPRFVPLAVEGDTTAGVTRQGVVRLRLPSDPLAVGVPDPGDEYLLGTGDFPPVLEQAEEQARVLFWVRATRRRADLRIGRVSYVGINATEVVQLRTAPPELLGGGTGDAGQRAALVHTPVLPGTVQLQVEHDGRWVDWQETTTLDTSRADARHYTLDPEAGVVRFGNGVRGSVPGIGERIRARSYQYGGGAAGNVAPKAIGKVTGVAQVRASNPLAARGGAPAETVAEGLERIPGEFRRHDRAVTESDFRELALMTPGAGVGRAECLPRLVRAMPNVEAAGVVTVVVWPREDALHPNAPMPDRTLLRAVCAWLDARRLVTTELHVIPPTYRRVAVAVGLEAKPGYGIEAVRRWVELVVRQYLAPLPPYGPDGGGWPLRRDVYGPELEAAALQVEGVDFLHGLSVAAWNERANAWEPAADQRVTLRPWEVPELAEITVVQGAPLVPGEALGPVPPSKTPVPIPTLREEC